ncbi:hypothetical protein PNA2_1802 [Pyrococcus sp. NA2]|uniref:diphthamide biosynthesis enzyme Dph2 n=1 Tax=Pyrococcus sp. (strain NA2) TaxID=342949 RepID=UPI000209ABFF|nr:diphthamide biosynthesis enzyme Dph2 [Pyrococcus sp. NA2]AEC52717.1 hypothetical protein PNA2_1802 [Pyrococcus sp. NA2]
MIHEIPKLEILKELKKLNTRRVLIQSPEGLRREAEDLANFLEEKGFEVILHGEINYGACDIADEEAKLLGCDVVIHLGHSYMKLPLKVPVIFVPAFAKVSVVNALKRNIDEIRKLGRRIVLTTTTQHIHQIKEAKKFLEENGFKVLIGKGDSRVSWPGQVLGCNYSTAKIDGDGILFIGSGTFHPLGLAIATGKRVLAINPYSGDCMWMDELAERFIRKRWAQIAKALDAKKFGIVISTKRGQLRLAEAKRILKLLKDHGRDAKLIVMNEVSYHKLEGFSFDAYVVVACPRIPLDDYEAWRKPVLTPKEVEILLKIKEEYEFDEIPGGERKNDEPLGISIHNSC